MREKTCCLTGHRRLSPGEASLARERLDRALRALIGDGVIYFGVGGAVGFDLLAADTVLALREEYPYIKLILVLACRDQAARWGAADQARLYHVCANADKVVCLQESYTADCMKARDRYLVDHSSVCVCWLTHYGGGTGYTEQYALKNGRQVVHLAAQRQENEEFF